MFTASAPGAPGIESPSLPSLTIWTTSLSIRFVPSYKSASNVFDGAAF
jgi:hypothetical protein